jgi:hypothetical protein
MADLSNSLLDDEADVLDTAIAAVEPTDDGGAVVDFDGAKPEAPEELPFDADLSSLFTDQALGKLGAELVALVNRDEESRADWRKTYARGLKLLGLKYEERTDPWEGACGAFHPLMLESVIRFQAQAMADIFPGSGPVKTSIVGRVTEYKERQAARVKEDLNWMTTTAMTGYREETDMMLFNLPIAGSTFRKFGFDKRKKLPWAEYVLPEHVIMPYSAASLDSTERFTVTLLKTGNHIDARIKEGFYRDVDLSSAPKKSTEITTEKDKIEGKRDSSDADDNLYRLFEINLGYMFEEDPMSEDGLSPYIVTVDSDTHTVMSIRRGWKDGMEVRERQVNLVQHKYMPGFGPYGMGLINILGGLTDSATSILRQLVDSGTLSNLPGGYKDKNLRVKGDDTPHSPGEWRDVEATGATLRESFFPLPYGEPSTVLAALLGQIVDEGRRIGSVADMKITDMAGQNMPVGTTLAIIERSMKVMSAVQQRLYNSFKNEFKVLSEIVHDFMGEMPYGFELDERDQKATRQEDYDSRLDVIPVADPNATTMAQRIMVLQAIIQLSQTAPAIYDLKRVHRDMITVLGSDKADFYIPPDEEVQPADPVTENMMLLTSKPVRAGVAQDHEAHITVHMAAAEDPEILKMLVNNPVAPAIQAATAAHVLEHLAFKYRAEIEQELGVPLPTPGEPLPEDVEYQIAGLAAAAADKLLGKHQAEEEQKRIIEDLGDPIIQNEKRKLDIEEKKVADKAETERRKDETTRAADRLDVLKTIFKEMSETERSTLAVSIQKGAAATEQQMRAAELAAGIDKSKMGEITKLFLGINAAKNKGPKT